MDDVGVCICGSGMDPDTWRAMLHPTFDAWLEYGVSVGWCSRDVCSTHDGIPSTEEEDALWEEGHDPCVHVLRLWPEGAEHE